MKKTTETAELPGASEVAPPLRVEPKSVKHVFTIQERDDIGSRLARAIGDHRKIEGELDEIKANFKAKLTEAEARIDTLSTSLSSGWDIREKQCVVLYSPKERRKYYFLEEGFVMPDPAEWPTKAIAAESMTADDFQAELIEAESKFDHKEEIPLFQPDGDNHGVLVVGRLGGRWFAALRIKVGRQELKERLDSEQKSVTERKDAVNLAAERALEWLETSLGKDAAKGFEDGILKVVEAHKERVE